MACLLALGPVSGRDALDSSSACGGLGMTEGALGIILRQAQDERRILGPLMVSLWKGRPEPVEG